MKTSQSSMEVDLHRHQETQSQDNQTFSSLRSMKTWNDPHKDETRCLIGL